jgi:hypothetical protein
MWLRVALAFELGAVNDIVACIRLHESNMTSDPLLMDEHLQVVIDNFYARPNIPLDCLGLRSAAKSRAKVRAAVFASRRRQFKLAIKFCLQALRHDRSNIDAYYLFARSLLRKAG